MEKSQAVDYTSIDYLEGLEAEPQSVSAGSDILAEAARYHVDLDTLETVGSSAAVPVQPAARPVYTPDAAEAAENIQENRFLDETDVRLRDMVNKVSPVRPSVCDCARRSYRICQQNIFEFAGY